MSSIEKNLSSNEKKIQINATNLAAALLSTFNTPSHLCSIKNSPFSGKRCLYCSKITDET